MFAAVFGNAYVLLIHFNIGLFEPYVGVACCSELVEILHFLSVLLFGAREKAVAAPAGISDQRSWVC